MLVILFLVSVRDCAALSAASVLTSSPEQLTTPELDPTAASA